MVSDMTYLNDENWLDTVMASFNTLDGIIIRDKIKEEYNTKRDTRCEVALSKNPKKIKDERFKAWQNLMVSAINVGLERKLFGIAEGENFWSDKKFCNRTEPDLWYTYTFSKMNVLVNVNDIGHGELSIYIIVEPTFNFFEDKDKRRITSCVTTKYCSVVLNGWFERKRGAWVMTDSGNKKMFSISSKKGFIPVFANKKVKPNGFVNHGRWIF